MLETIKSSDYDCIMVDESSYVSNKEQAVFCFSYVDEDLLFHGDFIDLYEMKQTDATSMVTLVKNIILRLGLEGEKLRGQCYGSCSIMMGKKKKLLTQIKKDARPLALSTHCYAHSLNLACDDDWIRNSTVVSKSLDTSYEITCKVVN